MLGYLNPFSYFSKSQPVVEPPEAPPMPEGGVCKPRADPVEPVQAKPVPAKSFLELLIDAKSILKSQEQPSQGGICVANLVRHRANLKKTVIEERTTENFKGVYGVSQSEIQDAIKNLKNVDQMIQKHMQKLEIRKTERTIFDEIKQFQDMQPSFILYNLKYGGSSF